MTAGQGISCVLVGVAMAPFVPEGVRAVIAGFYIGLGLLGLTLKALS